MAGQRKREIMTSMLFLVSIFVYLYSKLTVNKSNEFLVLDFFFNLPLVYQSCPRCLLINALNMFACFTDETPLK